MLYEVITSSRSSGEAVELVPVVTKGLKSPLFLAHAGDGSGQLFVVEQPGTIRLIDRGVLIEKPFLDLRDRVSARGEQGLLGLAFHPDHRHNGRLFVNYTRNVITSYSIHYTKLYEQATLRR